MVLALQGLASPYENLFFFSGSCGVGECLEDGECKTCKSTRCFFSNRRDLDLEVDRTQLSLEVGEIQLSLEVGDQPSFISAAPTQNFVTRMENASKLFNCELNKKTKTCSPLYLRNFQFNFQEEEDK